MFGFLKKRTRNEHMRLVSENRRMLSELERLSSLSAELGFGNTSATYRSEAILELICELDSIAVWLDYNEILTVEMTTGMLALHKQLLRQVSAVEEGRQIARKKELAPMASKYERFIASYLRLNAYFTITNFIVHAADDPTRISGGQIGNYTETDILGIRMPYSVERTGDLFIANHEALVAGNDGKIDVVIAEVKSGKKNIPNRVWKNGVSNHAIEYIVRFVGLHNKEAKISDAAKALASGFHFEDDRCRLRYIVFAQKINGDYASKGVTYITFRDVIKFLVEVRGQSWIECNSGVASCHTQWDEGLNEVFVIANDRASVDERIKSIERYLAT